MRGVAKRDLPAKACAHCGRPFTWRRKWARDWEAVKYCSEACRRGRGPATSASASASADPAALARPTGRSGSRR